MAAASLKPSTGLILTFLSPHPAYSRSAVQFLQQLFNLTPIVTSPSSSQSLSRDCLDEKHFGSFSSLSWHSAACMCNISGTMLHFLSLTDGKMFIIHDSDNKKPNSSLSLLSINEYTIIDDALSDCRKQLAHSMEGNQFFQRHSYLKSLETRLRGLSYLITKKMGRELQSSWLLANTPTLSLNKSNNTSSEVLNNNIESDEAYIGRGRNALREIAIPFFSEYSTVQNDLSSSMLSRPLPGLYQYNSATTNHGLVIRPLPAAVEDLRLPPPSLIFQCPSLDNTRELVERDLGGNTAKIGWRGDKHRGSLIVSHPSIRGLDVRINEDWVLSSSFDEAEQAVLAGSLDELQSIHVMSEGKNGEENISIDSKTNNSECWVEVRSNVKRPVGFLRRVTNPRIAKPPELPYD